MAKKDINFIRHIKPQIERKAREDKRISKLTGRKRAYRLMGLPQPEPITIEEMSVLVKWWKRLKGGDS